MAQWAQPQPQAVLPFFLSLISFITTSATMRSSPAETSTVPKFSMTHVIIGRSPSCFEIFYRTATRSVSRVASL